MPLAIVINVPAFYASDRPSPASGGQYWHIDCLELAELESSKRGCRSCVADSTANFRSRPKPADGLVATERPVFGRTTDVDVRINTLLDCGRLPRTCTQPFRIVT